jgi:hypothetical protein
MQINKKEILEQAKQLKVDFIVGNSGTKHLCGLHVKDEGSASLNEALSQALKIGYDRVYLYREDPKKVTNVSKINTNFNSNQSEYSKIKMSLDNLKNTFGVDILKAVAMTELTLTENRG